MQPIIRIENLGKCYPIYEKPVDRLKQMLFRGRRRFYKEFWAIRDLSLDIHANETVGVVGSNGSGKSTLLQLVCGILTPSTGRLTVRGRVAGLLELGAGFNPHFSGRENIHISAAILGLSEAQIAERTEAIIAFADLGDFIDRPVKTYSSGMYVRLGFAVAISVDPRILVIDEALAVGDARFRQKCMGRIKRFCQEGTVIIVSHDMGAITELCTRAVWVEGGRLLMEGAPKLVVEKYLEYMYEGQLASNPPSAGTPPALSRMRGEGYLPVTEAARQFGNQAVAIEAVRMRSDGRVNGVAFSGKACEIDFLVRCRRRVAQPICGFIVKDRLGRDLMADNTALLRKTLPAMQPDTTYRVRFAIDQWPNFRSGEYTLTLAVANGSIDNFQQCQWVHEALVFDSIPVRQPGGILSVIETDVMVDETVN